MTDPFLRRLRSLDLEFHPPASPRALQGFGRKLSCEVPEDVRVLYEDHDGAEDGRGVVPFRMLSIAEAVDFHRATGSFAAETGLSLRAFWTDDNSNYVAVHVDGPLLGRVSLLDHDSGGDVSPAYRSVRSFLEALLDAAEAGEDAEMLTDHPVDRGVSTVGVRASTAAERRADREVARTLAKGLSEIADDDARRVRAFNVMALTPPDEARSLLAFLDDGDMWIAERACFLLGFWKHEPAIARLAEIARTGAGNPKGAAIRALGSIGSAASREALWELIDPLGRVLTQALEACGCEIKHGRGKCLARRPGDADWRLLG